MIDTPHEVTISSADFGRALGYTLAIRAPTYAGYLVLGGKHGLQLGVTEKPSWLHRTALRVLMGIEYLDLSKQETK